MMTEETNAVATDSKIDQIKNLFGGDFAPEVIEDSEGLDFDKPIKGKYVCRITGLERRAGTSQKTGNDYDFFALKLQAEEDVEGDRSANRYLDKTYFVGTSQYEEDPDGGIKKLFNDLFTAGVLEGIDITSTDKYEVAESLGPQLVDKLVKVTCWASKKGNQIVKVVNEHKLSGKKVEETTESTDW
jgi:hypothetical protein